MYRMRLCLALVLLASMTACNLSLNAAEPAAPGATPSPNALFAAAGLDSTLTSSATASSTSSPSPSPSPSATITPSPTPSSTATETPSPTPSETPTPEPSLTPTPTLTPTYAILRGRVLELANCRYGPGAPYLYKYALIEGSNLEVIGRNDAGTWILVQAIGGDNPCWVKASLLQLNGDVMSVAPTYIPLPSSPYYGPLSGVGATRNGNEVIVSWDPLYLREGDDSGQYLYLVEAWVCQNGALLFMPIGSYEPIVNIPDEAGCAEPSHGRVYGVEKHGYTPWVEIPWPAPP